MLVSVVIPAYNAEKYIKDAIESVLRQSFPDWELIVVDDCSEDETAAIVEHYAQSDDRIKLMRRPKNSGGCRLPRFDGVGKSVGDFICTLDADDGLEDDYLQKMLARSRETEADIVVGRMVFCREDMTRMDGRAIPLPGYDMEKTLSGAEACKETIGHWHIAMNGALYKANFYRDYVRQNYHALPCCGYADELDHRCLLLRADKVCLTGADYYYRQVPGSIVHDRLQAFHRLATNKHLYAFVKRHFADDEAVMRRMHHDYLDGIYRAQISLYKYAFAPSERRAAVEEIRNAYRPVAEEGMRFATLKMKLLASSFLMLRILSYLASKW